MGWRQPRITGDEYYAFIDQVINAIKRRWPKALIQFEDFAQNNAMPILQTYRNKICCFNDDIQGTAAVSVGSLIAASRAAGKQQRSGCGIPGCRLSRLRYC